MGLNVFGLSLNPDRWLKRQPIATLDEVPPTQNEWYTVLDTTTLVAVRYVMIFQENDEAASKTIELKYTWDGLTVTGAKSMTESAWNYWNVEPPDNDGGTCSLNDNAAQVPAGSVNDDLGIMLFAHSLKIEVRITSTLGTNQELRARVDYYRFERI